MPNLSTADKLSAARMSAVRAFPYFRAGIMRLVFRAAPGLGTLGVTKGWVVLYDPAVVDTWSVRALGTVIVHELMHLLRRHADRQERMSAEHERWNVAGDCVAGGTQVLLPDGSSKSIEAMRPGDAVVGVQQGQMVRGYVQAILARPRDEIGVELSCNSAILDSTYEHRVLTLDGYVEVRHAVASSTAEIFRVRTAIHYEQCAAADDSRNSKAFGKAFPERAITYAIQKAIRTTTDRATSQRQANAADAPNISGAAPLELALCKASRKHIKKGTIYYDLVTTCHSFVANGFVVHNCEINDDLVTAGCEMPAGTDPCVPGRFGLADGLSAEEYYRALPDGGGKGKGEDKDGEGEGDGESADDQTSGGKGTGKGKGKGKVMNGQCGGGAGGEPLPGEADADAEDGRGTAEQKRIERIVAEAVRQAASKGRGTVLGSWARWAGEVLDPPKVPWQQKLSRAVRQSVAYRPGAVDYRYSRISRRQSGVGYGLGRPVLAALVAPQPRISVVVDTSGSMGDRELTSALSEVRGVLAAAGGDVDLCACDAEVHELRRVRSWVEAARLLKGGGGTDMRPALEALARQKTRPDVVVVLTDGMIGDPGEAPPYRVVWAVVGGNDFTCPWGEVVKVEKEAK